MLNVIINGNSIEEMAKMPKNSIDLIFADPPYWMRISGTLHRVEGTEFDGCNDDWDQFNSLDDYKTFTYKWLSECYRILKPNGTICVIGGMQCIYTIGSIMQDIGFWFINDIIWNKKNPTPNFTGTRLNNSHETLIWATKSPKSKFTFNYKTAKELNNDTVSVEDFNKGIRKQLGSVWRISICSGNERLRNENGEKLHSTQKPEELLYRIIAISTKLGDTVLDPFGGTMTTGAIAKQLGRNYIMIEQNKEYCKSGQERLEKITFEDSPIAHAIFDKKPLKVSMEEMILANYFIENENFYFNDGKPIATLLSNGKLLFNNETIDMHSCAAKAKKLKAKRVNGFNHWYVIRNDNLVLIDDIRKQYRKDKELKEMRNNENGN